MEKHSGRNRMYGKYGYIDMNPAGAVIRREYDDGTVVKTEKMEKVVDPESGKTLRRSIPNRVYWVVTPEGERFYFEKGRSYINRHHAIGFAELWYRTGGFDIPEEKSAIPVEVAVLGNAAIAAYLRIISGFDRCRIAEMMNIAENTAQQYINKFRKGQR